MTGPLSPSGRVVLLNPGPVNVSERVRKALLHPDICHREPELTTLLDSVRSKLCAAFAPEGGYHAAVLAGSGTAAVEAMVRAAVDRGGKLLVVGNGVYGERIAAMARSAGTAVEMVSAEWFERPRLEDIDACLAADPAIEAVAIVHHETTTGLLNPVAEVGEIARAHGRRLVVDSVSGLAGDEIDLQRIGAAMCAGTAGKNIQGFPGVGFVLVAQGELERVRAAHSASVYLDLARYIDASGQALVPFTPPVQLLAAFEAALEELLEETVAGRIARYRELALFVRDELSRRGLKMLVPEPWRSNCLTSFALPTGVSYDRLHGELKDSGYVIYAGQGDLQSKAFRVSTMGTVTRAELAGFASALDEVLG